MNLLISGVYCQCVLNTINTIIIIITFPYIMSFFSTCIVRFKKQGQIRWIRLYQLYVSFNASQKTLHSEPSFEGTQFSHYNAASRFFKFVNLPHLLHHPVLLSIGRRLFIERRYRILFIWRPLRGNTGTGGKADWGVEGREECEAQDEGEGKGGTEERKIGLGKV